jgi:hypothetical protein
MTESKSSQERLLGLAWQPAATLRRQNRLVQFLRGVKDTSIPEADREAVIAAFREILLNAMEHGGHFDPRHYVEVSFVRASPIV